jgi:short-subunit dehydrogenase
MITTTDVQTAQLSHSSLVDLHMDEEIMEPTIQINALLSGPVASAVHQTQTSMKTAQSVPTRVVGTVLQPKLTSAESCFHSDQSEHMLILADGIIGKLILAWMF